MSSAFEDAIAALKPHTKQPAINLAVKLAQFRDTERRMQSRPAGTNDHDTTDRGYTRIQSSFGGYHSQLNRRRAEIIKLIPSVVYLLTRAGDVHALSKLAAAAKQVGVMTNTNVQRSFRQAFNAFPDHIAAA